MALNIVLDEGAIKPTRAHEYDAGLDIYAREDATLFPGRSAIFDTGVHVEIPKGYAGFLKSKSGLNCNHGIVSEGVIDTGYTGSIRVKLYNHGNRTYRVKAGDKISQLVILPVMLGEVNVVEEISGEGDRGNNGFGSSGR